MSERLADVATQLRSVRQLSAIVIAMRGVAASRAQQGRALLTGIGSYSDVVAGGIGRALTLASTDDLLPAGDRSAARALIVFGAEQGFVGSYDERIFAAARGMPSAAVTFVIGSRGAMHAAEHGISVAWSQPMVTQSAAIPRLADRIAEMLYARIGSGTISEVDMLYPRATAGSSIEVVRRSLFPVDFSRFARPLGNQPPLISMAPAALLEHLVGEYVYAELCAAATFAFTAENEARMMVMAAAKSNIDAKLDELGRRERELRQQEITAEHIELAAGAEALRTDRG